MLEDKFSKYSVTGYYEFKVNLSMKTLTTTNEGPTRVKFAADGQQVTFYLPTTKINGMGSRNRRVTVETAMYVEDPNNELYALISFSGDKVDG